MARQAKCCGQDVTTKFCPHCGKETVDSIAKEIIRHFRTNEHEAEKRIARRQAWIDRGDRAEELREQVSRLENLRDKWKARREYVENLLANQKELP